MILRVSISLWENLHLFTREVILVLRSWIPSTSCCHTSDRSSFQKYQSALRLDCSGIGIKDFLGGSSDCQGDGAILDEDLKALLIFTLKHNFELLPVLTGGVFFLYVDVKGFQEVDSSD